MAIFKYFMLIRHTSKQDDAPSQFEQDIAKAYVCDRQLYRPVTNAWSFIRNSLIILAMTALITYLIHIFFRIINAYEHFPISWQQRYIDNPRLFLLFSFLIILLLLLFIFLRRILIGIIHLYQHYSSEDIRRRCIYKPTCSEYAELAILKFGVMIGLYKAYIRLFKKCKGIIYKIDYP